MAVDQQEPIPLEVKINLAFILYTSTCYTLLLPFFPAFLRENKIDKSYYGFLQSE